MKNVALSQVRLYFASYAPAANYRDASMGTLTNGFPGGLGMYMYYLPQGLGSLIHLIGDPIHGGVWR